MSCGHSKTPTDTTPPTTPANLAIPTSTSETAPKFTWDSASDDLSGISSYLLRIDGAGWIDVGGYKWYKCSTALAVGSHTVEVKAVDNAGNEGSPAILNFTITAPIIIEILSVTSPVNSGANATLSAKTEPQAQCSIAVVYKSGPSTAEGLEDKTADTQGNVSWTWRVGAGTSPESYSITINAKLGDRTGSQTTHFTVT